LPQLLSLLLQLQVPLEVLHTLPLAAAAQSLLPPHPQTPLLHWLPSGELAHPGAHLPAEQQPPLHCEEALHEVEQVPLPALHADPVGQSPEELHPQTPPVSHFLPLAVAEQSTQAPPAGAHVESPMPVHVPPGAPLQQ
jgi:hypothetical protein